ncbi:late competence development ComFB family protein [Maridesulfovibrio sp.]|uniref:late competence development ComFB family protein n=1 Tax=unclassified Maridesulfovibrio TaxID=2794999 RepID=UPI003B007F4F
MLSKNDFFKNGEIVNLAEQVVYEELVALIDRAEIEFCQCDKCLFDIACVVLNNIPSLYSSSIADRTYPSKEFKAEYDKLKLLAAAEIPQAIERIKGRLHH